MAKKHGQGKTLAKSNIQPLDAEDLERIVGGAATQQQYDTAKQNLLGEINNSDITNAVAADAASIAASPTQAHITAAISDIEGKAGADHVSEVAALAALDAATYGNAKVGGNDAIAAELTKVLTNGTGEADMAHVAALGANPTTLVTELNQAVNVLAMGSSSGHTALGVSTTAAIDWVEAKLEAAAGVEAQTNANAAAAALQQAASNPSIAAFATSVANVDTQQSQAATGLQTLLDTAHQGEVTEGRSIDAVMTALGSHAAQVAADAATLVGLTGAAAVTAGQTEVAAVEAIAGLQKDLGLVALDLMAQGNAGVQQALSTELTSGAIETNLAQAVATGQITADQAVQTLNLAVTDLAQNSVNAATVPALEQGFAIGEADVALANAAASLAASDNLAASGYGVTTAQAATDHQQAALASSLQTLINTNYAADVAMVTELNSAAAILGSNAASYIAEGGNLIANPSLAQGYINAVEAAAQNAEAGAAPGATHGAFSVDAALTLLAVYSHGNATVLGAIEARLSSGAAETDLANLAALGVITPAQAVTTLGGLVDAVAAASPNNAVTLTASDGQSLMLDRNSAFDWAEGQLAKTVLTMQGAVVTDTTNLAVTIINSLFGAATSAQVTAAMKALTLATAEFGNVNQFATLLETSQASEILTGLGIDVQWTATNASIDAAAALAAGTQVVQTGYGPENQVSAAATAQANAINAAAAGVASADFSAAETILQAYLGTEAAATAAQGGGDSAVESSTESLGAQLASLFGKGLAVAEFANSTVAGVANVSSNPASLAAWGGLGTAVGTDAVIALMGAGAGEFETAGLAAQGMAWLLDQDAVSNVLGTALSGQLAADFAFIAQVSNGLAGMIGVAIDVTATDGFATVKDLGENLSTFSTDLYHGNFSALQGDAQKIVSQFGSDFMNLSFDMVGSEENFLQPFADEVREFFVNTVNFIDGSHAPDWGSAIKWVDAEGDAIIQDLVNAGHPVTEIADWFEDQYNDASSMLSDLSKDVSGISSSVESAISSALGSFGSSASSGIDKVISWLGL